jgi:hypothetical protein
MPLLTAAVTILGLGGTPTIQGGPYDHSPPTSGRTYSSAFTRLGTSGLPGRPFGAFTGKAEKTADTFFVSDSLRIYLTEGDFSDVDVDVTDSPILRVGESVFPSQSLNVSDTVRLRATEAIFSLSKSGTIAKFASDTLTLVVTETVGKTVVITVADTIKPVVTEGNSVEKAAVKTVSDTITPVVSDGLPLLSIFAADNLVVGTDTLTFSVVDSAIVRTSGEVDHIHIVATPKGRIRINRA